jgi:pimeloyl-ACP methyl ester carboxylesterase
MWFCYVSLERLWASFQQHWAVVAILFVSIILTLRLLFPTENAAHGRRPLLYQATSSQAQRVEPLSTQRLIHKIVLPSKEPSSKTLLVVIPGNPGVPGFYEPFMRHLHALAMQQLEIVGLSHTNHSMPWLNGNKAFDLDCQIADKVAYVRKRLEKDSQVKLIVVGHSIGAHIALEILRHFPNRVHKLVLMQPAVMHIAQSPNGRRMALLFKQHSHLVSYLVWPVAACLPTSMQKRLVSFVLGRSHNNCPYVIQASLSLFDPVVVRNILKMSRHEMLELKGVDHSLVFAHQEKVLFLFSTVDGWVPQTFVDALTSTFTRARHQMVTLPHAFMTAPHGSEMMAELVWPWIQPMS